MPNVHMVDPTPENPAGLTHLAFSLGSMKSVDRLTDELQKGGYPIASAPRKTGDGYYESVILEPDCIASKSQPNLLCIQNLKAARYNHR